LFGGGGAANVGDNNLIWVTCGCRQYTWLMLLVGVVLLSIAYGCVELKCGDVESNPGPHAGKRCAACGICARDLQGIGTKKLFFFQFPNDR